MNIQELLDQKRQKAKELYKQSRAFKALVYGKAKSGKTSLIATCRKPILVHSFDADGLSVDVLQPLIESGDLIPDTRFENEKWSSPTAFDLWEQEFEELRKANAFSALGTYVIDSTTTWAMAMLNQIAKRSKRPGQPPQLQDYNVQQLTIMDYVGLLLSLPCDVILTGHIDLSRDEVTGKMETGLLVPGKLSTKMLLAFSNVFVTEVQQTQKGANYVLKCIGDGYYVSGSRVAPIGKIQPIEPQDIKALLKKIGLPSNDITKEQTNETSNS
jgi:hypothetical protein